MGNYVARSGAARSADLRTAPGISAANYLQAVNRGDLNYMLCAVVFQGSRMHPQAEQA